MNYKKNVGFIIFLVIVAILLIRFALLPPIITELRLDEAVRIAKSADMGTEVLKDKKDWWGNLIVISRLANEEGTAIVYTAISAGKDGKYGTKDDLISSVTDLNKSKIAGKWAGEKGKQFLKGLKEGVKSESKHDK